MADHWARMDMCQLNEGEQKLGKRHPVFAMFNSVTGVLVFRSLFFSMFIDLGTQFTFYQQLNLAVLKYFYFADFCGVGIN
jgi:hypothetical protein